MRGRSTGNGRNGIEARGRRSRRSGASEPMSGKPIRFVTGQARNRRDCTEPTVVDSTRLWQLFYNTNAPVFPLELPETLADPPHRRLSQANVPAARDHPTGLSAGRILHTTRLPHPVHDDSSSAACDYNHQRPPSRLSPDGRVVAPTRARPWQPHLSKIVRRHRHERLPREALRPSIANPPSKNSRLPSIL